MGNVLLAVSLTTTSDCQQGQQKNDQFDTNEWDHDEKQSNEGLHWMLTVIQWHRSKDPLLTVSKLKLSIIC